MKNIKKSLFYITLLQCSKQWQGENEKIIKQTAGISEVCDQNGDRVL